jgi:hypothetical protein
MATGKSIAWTKYGKAYTGHWGFDGAGQKPLVSTTGSQFGANVGTSMPTGWLLRDFEDDDVSVELGFRIGMSDTSLVGGMTIRIGVAARVRAQTLTDGGTATAHLLNGEGYYFLFACDLSQAPNGARFYLVRVNAGATTVLVASPAVGTGDFLAWYSNNAAKQMRLRVRTNGGNVELEGYTRTGSGQEVLLLSATDSSGGKITAAGRCGFFCSNEFLESVRAIAPRVSFFAVATWAGVLHSYDDWTRYAASMAASVAQTFTGAAYTSFSFDGYDLTSGWFGDLTSLSTYSSRIARSGDRIQFDSSVSDKSGFYLSRRMEDHDRTQDRKIDFEFASGSMGASGVTRKAGVAVRCSTLRQVPGMTPDTCYYATAELIEDSLAASIKLWRVRGTTVLLAHKITGVTITRGVVYELRLAVATLAVPDPVEGFARLKVFLDGVQVVLVDPTSPITGVFVAADGTVTDQSSSRVTSGWGAGVYIGSKVGANAHILLNDWDVGDTAGSSSTEQSQATIAVSASDDGVTGTFSVPYDWSTPIEADLISIRHEHEDGGAYTARARSVRARRWLLGCSAATEAEVDSLVSFFDDHDGDAIPFTFAPPIGPDVTARFVGGTLQAEKKDAGVYAWSVVVEEVASG